MGASRNLDLLPLVYPPQDQRTTFWLLIRILPKQRLSAIRCILCVSSHKETENYAPQHSVKDCGSWQEFKSETLHTIFEGKAFGPGVFLFRGHGSSEWPLKASFDRWFIGPRRKKKQVSERLVELFQKEAEGLPIERSIWEDHSRCLALAQHHGVPTRLLDWTESPYVFTLLRAPYDTLEEYVSHFEQAGAALLQIRIPVGEARRALADLEMMGINYTQIYPGLDGSARTAQLRTRWELLPDN